MQGAFDAFAMGNYPYASDYMGADLPAWPMRAACDLLGPANSPDLLEVGIRSDREAVKLLPLLILHWGLLLEEV